MGAMLLWLSGVIFFTLQTFPYFPTHPLIICPWFSLLNKIFEKHFSDEFRITFLTFGYLSYNHWLYGCRFLPALSITIVIFFLLSFLKTNFFFVSKNTQYFYLYTNIVHWRYVIKKVLKRLNCQRLQELRRD